MSNHAVLLILLVLLPLLFPIQMVLCSCGLSSCGGTPIKYPFGVDDGCGSPSYRHMLDCSGQGHEQALVLRNPSAANSWVRIRSIDYAAGTMIVVDPGMSTCSDLEPARGTGIPNLQYSAFITPYSMKNGLFLMNCSGDSPVLSKPICFDNIPGSHTCYELYEACSSFKVIAAAVAALPPCCFTTYDTVRNMSLNNELKCSHYTSVYDTNGLKEGTDPVDWQYGMKLSFYTPAGCDACHKSGGACGYDVNTLGLTCLCNPLLNATRECAPGTVPSKKGGLSTVAIIIIIMIIAATFLLGGVGVTFLAVKLKVGENCIMNCFNGKVNNTSNYYNSNSNGNSKRSEAELLRRTPTSSTKKGQTRTNSNQSETRKG
ncbi:OLC1v1038212C1 [Oldenlandia corymbosa var. corymbosa]|uniref:non-specific serine/threonine protein kinase n=1 Tax=Oldenlandia corymbosa var. corymbosa TaxID=529605 RepID=A0AAV1D0H9_OLDCO|nr:OLC1v1038212C1 [Oldenlandia corymbosa var. corymbosa]